MSKKIMKISLITIVLMVLLACFRFTYASVADKIGDAIGGFVATSIVGVLSFGLQQFAGLLFGAIDLLTQGITGIAYESDRVATIGDVIFNRCALTTANFFRG